MSEKLRILISGAGIGGPVAAYWLSKAGIHVTVVERASELRKEGQTVDIRKEGLDIVKRMGIREIIDERTTKEVGLRLVDDKDQVWAEFGQSASGDEGFTSEVEIVRGELSKVLYEVSKESVNYVFNTTIDDFTEVEGGVNVTLKNHSDNTTSQQTYHVIIVSEGLYSRTRAKAFNEPITQPIHTLNRFSATYSLPAHAKDTQWANGILYHGHRMILLRPDGFGQTRVSLNWSTNPESLAESRDIAHPKTPTIQQKTFIKSLYKDLIPTSPMLKRVMDKFDDSDDLYIAEIGQTKTPSWSVGRVILLGDTAYCPSAMSGMGTTTAIVGGYILASELVQHSKDKDYKTAFQNYENHLRPWIEKIQNIPRRIWPSGKFGLAIMYYIFWIVSVLSKKFGFLKILGRLLPSINQSLTLPPVSVFEL